MRQKKGWIAGIAVIAVIALLFVGYNLYRYPAMFRSLSDNSLNDSQVEELREEILSQPDVDVLVSYFSYSGNTRNVAAALSEKTGGDLFEIAPLNGYSIEMSVMTEVSDLEAVMEAASEWDFADESRIVLFGTSQGGGAALLLGSIFNDITKAVASDQPFLTNLKMADGRGAYGIGADLCRNTDKETIERGQYLIDTVHHVHRFNFPILLTSGGKDDQCPPETIRDLFSRLKGTKSYTHFEHLAHSYNREFIQLVKAWFLIYA